MIKLDTASVKNPGFKDVSTSNGFYKAIAAMAEKGIIGGYPNDSYKPNDPINRKNMAAILVKAFDLPRDADVKNPFKDSSGITDDVLIIYKLGITTGTSPTAFSPNAFIKRGQAAKMLKATEEVNTRNVVTLEPSDLGWDTIYFVNEAGKEAGLASDVFKAVFIKGKEGYTKDKVQLIPQKEGKGAVILGGTSSGELAAKHRKYYVYSKKVDNEFKLTLEETNDIRTTPVIIDSQDNPIQNIALSTMDGKKLTESAETSTCETIFHCIDIEEAGQYIANVRYTDGDEVRYGIEAKAENDSFQYLTRRVKEQPAAVLKIDETYDIGKHKLYPENQEQIAAVTRDPGTNTFRITGKKEGRIEIDFEKPNFDEEHYEVCNTPGDCGSHVFTGAYVLVEQIGSIIGVYAGKFYSDY
ncbi:MULTISPECIES: S-layer homology domain-containing protein [unclassified Sporosarcina]|uniref:S-layer homology domain-containing protein n=1 Tax=unclassified Sporosarcina TaxID=2647733 RepID=UPI00203B1CDE|nr:MULTISPECIES: S-layer homology domain-containing protein [unclassified Sporosarcina]GKV67281.1 hypothetical protein NCCP2331_34340 [Sporosarcina sp. NCCP-2331]GLB57622.1 hypothetical protein NCCP2378_34120 [Sporosarcina sp. NCCP-2378]